MWKRNLRSRVSCVGRRKVSHPFCLRLCNLRTSKTLLIPRRKKKYRRTCTRRIDRLNEMYRAFQITKPLTMQVTLSVAIAFYWARLIDLWIKQKRDLKLRFKNRNLNIYKQITLELELKCNCVAREIKTLSAVRLEKCQLHVMITTRASLENAR